MVNKDLTSKYANDYSELKIRRQRLINTLVLLNDKEVLEKTKNYTLENNSDYIIPMFFADSAIGLAHSIWLVADNAKNVPSTAVLSRSILECLANIEWLHESYDDRKELKTKTGKIFKMSESIYWYYDKQKDVQKLPTITDIGAGSIVNRLDKRGSGWRLLYSHLSAYAHVDTSYYIHRVLKWDKGILNYILSMVDWAILDCAKMLSDLVQLSDKTKRLILSEVEELELYHKQKLKNN